MKSFVFLIFFYILIPKSLGGTISLFRLENNNNNFYAEDGFCSQNFTVIGSFESEPTSFDISSLYIYNYKLFQTVGNSYYYQISTSCSVGRYMVDSFSYKVFSIFNESIPEIIFDCLEPPNPLNWEIEKKLITTNPPSPNIYFTLKVNNVTKKLNLKPENYPYPYSINFIEGHLTGTTYLAQFKLTFTRLNPLSNILNEFLFVNISYNSFSNSNIVFNLSSPINENNGNICDSISAKRAGNIISNGFWDTGLYTTCFTIGKSVSKLFLYQNLEFGTQWFKMVGGNETNSQLLSSFLPLEIPFTILNVTSHVFDIDDYLTLTNIYVYNEYISEIIVESSVFVNSSNGLGKTSIPIVRDPRSALFEIRTGSSNTYKGYKNFRHFKYPYGVGKGRIDDFEYISSVYIPSVSSLYYYYCTLSFEGYLYEAIPPAHINKVPTINNIEIYYPRGGDGKRAILKVSLVSNGAGLSWMRYCGNIITELDLVNGSIYNGYYEKLINVTFEKTPIVIMSTEGKFNEISQNYLDEDPFVLKEIPYINAFNNSVNGKSQSLSVSKFEFKAQNVNVDNGFLQTLYFDYIDSAFDIPISFYLLDPIYDKNENVFKIQFVILPRKCSGSLPYIIKVDGVSYSMDYFYSLFGNAANLSVTSTDCDEMPPIIKNITYFKSTIDASGSYGNIFNISGQVQDVELGWTVTIEDRINGLKSAYFRIIGDKDPLPLEFNFTPENGLISGDKFTGQYNIRFKVKPTTAGQTYRFENIILIDNSGHKSQIMDDNYKYQDVNIEIRYSPLSPIYNLDSTTMEFFNFTVKSKNDQSDITPPSLDYFKPTAINLDINTFNRDISFIFNTSDNIGLLYDTHKPIVFLEYYINDITLTTLTNIECNTELKETVIDPSTNLTIKAHYEAFCSIPYGFSSSKGFIASVFGIVDTSFNFNGYSAYDLDIAGVKSYISTNQTITLPSIENLISTSDINESNFLNINKLLLKESNSLIDSISSEGSFITIIGKHFGFKPTISIIDNFNSQVENSIVYSSNVMVIIKVIPFNSERLFITVKDEIKKVESNTIEVTVSPLGYSSSSSTSTPNDVVCLNNCGGLNRGVCIENIGCRCISPYSGFDCLSKTVKTPQPLMSTTSPDSINNFLADGNGAISLNTIVSIVAIREINLDNSVENIHCFKENDWISTTISSTNVIYNSKIIKGANQVSTITVIAEWFEKETQITFAGEDFTINPSSLKYTISIDHYPFSTPLNTLELIFKSSVETSKTNDICSSEQFGLNDNSNYLELQVGEFSFLSKYLKRAIIDNVVRSISNKLLTDFNQNEKLSGTTSSKKLSFIAIEIPLFKSKIEIDPDFSVLLNPNPASSNSDNSICTSSSSSSLSKPIIAGIVIGSVVFFIILILFILTLIPPHYKISIRLFYHKLRKH
ncbi:hypothetical protein ACTFIY_006590 [Dictyostelium cf. discoideum]